MADYDPDDAATVRLLIADQGTDDDQLYDDDQLGRFLALEGGDVRLAAAAALEAIARSEVMLSKVIRTQDLSTDGAKVSAELRAHAALLRQQAEVDDDDVFIVNARTCQPELVHGWRWA